VARVGTLVLAAALAYGGTGSAAEPAALRVLFVGNSLTRSNDLPARVAGLAAASGRKLRYRTVVYAGFSLEDHWNLGAARPELASGEWDVVVMQQGPSSLPESQEHLRTWASRFAELARGVDTRPALLTVWPERERRSALADVVSSYRLAAEAAGAELLPAGAAWQAAWRCGLRPSLYGSDGFHPSALGTYEAALVAYGGLFGAPVRVRALAPKGEKARTARLLQTAAASALGRPLPPDRRCG
jgi:hypothetical protein